MNPGPYDSVADVRLAGGPIRWYAAGVPDGDPILLLHGGMLDTARIDWRFLVPRLAATRRVYAIDLPRHGGSRPWTGVLDHARCQQVLHAVLDHLGLERVTLIGHSLGAGISIGYALDHPDRVRRAVLLAPGGVDERRSWQFTTWAAIRTPGLLHWTSWLLARSPGLVRRSMVYNLAAGEDTPDLDAILGQVQAEAEARWAAREPALDDWQATAFGPFRMRLNLQPRLGELTVPTLWARGEHDPLVGERVMATAARASGGRFETVPDAGHLLPLDQPERLHALVEEFLATTTAD